MTQLARRRASTMYVVSRKNAEITRTNSADGLFISDRTLARYELGEGTPGPDVALAMSKLYKDPRLADRYCLEVCPIGRERAAPINPIRISAFAMIRVDKERKISGMLGGISGDRF